VTDATLSRFVFALSKEQGVIVRRQDLGAVRAVAYRSLGFSLRYREVNVRVYPSGKVTATRSPLASFTTPAS
jgi:hypothetical protein